MKKLIFITILTFSTAVLVSSVWAATLVSFSPSSVNVTQGQTFNITVTLNPQGVKNYTTKLELKYPTDFLEAKSFTFGSNSSWIPLSQPGYDLIDNTNGVLIKSAGYPGGVSSPITFGTVSFLAKKSGNGTIALNSNSFVLDANNQNVVGGATVQTAVAISAPTPTTPAPAPKEEKPAVQPEQETPIVQEPTTAPQPIERSLLAAVGSVVTLGTNSVIVGLLVVIVILALVGYAIYAVIQRTRHKNLGKL